MPYRHAHYLLLLLIALTGLAFWPMYFAVLPSAAGAIHFHAFTASTWIVLLAFQSWAIHHQSKKWHRIVGIASLGVFPFFFAGCLLIVHTMASNFATGDLFDGLFGARFAAVDLVAVVAIAWLYWSGLRWRRKVHLHARYMVATVFFLLAPIFTRLFAEFVPGLQLKPPKFEHLPFNVELATFGALLLALALAWSQPKHARPWMISAGLLALQLVLFSTLGVFRSWKTLMRIFAGLPTPLLFSSGLAVGALISWLGWNSLPPRREHAVGASATVGG
jgi:hypothetical protein